MPPLKKVSHQFQVPYRAKDLYGLVAGINAYPEFLPWCKASSIIREIDNVVEARLILSKSGISKAFSTRNLMTPETQIEMHLLEGPFKHLYGLWTFTDNEQGCLVNLKLEFSFDNRLIAMMLEPIFNTVADTLLQAFIDRAHIKCQKI